MPFFSFFLISLAAGIMVRKKFISQEQIQALSAVTVNVFLPCLIIAKTLIRFRPEELPQWWILPVAGFLIVLAGLVYSGILFRFKPDKRPQIALASLQNGIYIPLPVGQILFPDQFDLFALYCFLLLIGLNAMMWSLGAVMLGQKQGSFKLKDFITPPLASVFLSRCRSAYGIFRIYSVADGGGGRPPGASHCTLSPVCSRGHSRDDFFEKMATGRGYVKDISCKIYSGAGNGFRGTFFQ